MVTRVLKRNAPILSLTNYWEYDDYKGEENYKQFLYDLTCLFRPIQKDGFEWKYDRSTGEVVLTEVCTTVVPSEKTNLQLAETKRNVHIHENQIIVVDTSKKGIDAVSAHWLGDYQDQYQEEYEHKKEVLESFSVGDLLDEVKRKTGDLT